MPHIASELRELGVVIWFARFHVSEEVNQNVQPIAESTAQTVEMASSAEIACMALAEQCESR